MKKKLKSLFTVVMNNMITV